MRRHASRSESSAAAGHNGPRVEATISSGPLHQRVAPARHFRRGVAGACPGKVTRRSVYLSSDPLQKVAKRSLLATTGRHSVGMARETKRSTALLGPLVMNNPDFAEEMCIPIVRPTTTTMTDERQTPTNNERTTTNARSDPRQCQLYVCVHRQGVDRAVGVPHTHNLSKSWYCP